MLFFVWLFLYYWLFFWITLVLRLVVQIWWLLLIVLYQRFPCINVNTVLLVLDQTIYYNAMFNMFWRLWNSFGGDYSGIRGAFFVSIFQWVWSQESRGMTNFNRQFTVVHYQAIHPMKSLFMMLRFKCNFIIFHQNELLKRFYWKLENLLGVLWVRIGWFLQYWFEIEGKHIYCRSKKIYEIYVTKSFRIWNKYLSVQIYIFHSKFAM